MFLGSSSYSRESIKALVANPQNREKAVAATAQSVGRKHALSKIETIPLMSMEEGLEAFRKAQSASYTPPGSQ